MFFIAHVFLLVSEHELAIQKTCFWFSLIIYLYRLVNFPSMSLHSLKLTERTWKKAISQKETHLPTTDFQGRTVSFREGSSILKAHQPSKQGPLHPPQLPWFCPPPNHGHHLPKNQRQILKWLQGTISGKSGGSCNLKKADGINEELEVTSETTGDSCASSASNTRRMENLDLEGTKK